jgi:hypothetical protein
MQIGFVAPSKHVDREPLLSSFGRIIDGIEFCDKKTREYSRRQGDAMASRSTQIRGLPALATLLRGAKKRAGERTEVEGEAAQLAAKFVEKCLKRAFRDAKLDINRDDHWHLLAISLAIAVYAGRDPGAPLKWSTKSRLQLVDDIEKIRQSQPRDKRSDTECCKLLLKQPPYSQMRTKEKNKPLSAGALRRVLSDARRLKSELAAVAGLASIPALPIEDV